MVAITRAKARAQLPERKFTHTATVGTDDTSDQQTQVEAEIREILEKHHDKLPPTYAQEYAAFKDDPNVQFGDVFLFHSQRTLDMPPTTKSATTAVLESLHQQAWKNAHFNTALPSSPQHASTKATPLRHILASKGLDTQGWDAQSNDLTVRVARQIPRVVAYMLDPSVTADQYSFPAKLPLADTGLARFLGSAQLTDEEMETFLATELPEGLEPISLAEPKEPYVFPSVQAATGTLEGLRSYVEVLRHRPTPKQFAAASTTDGSTSDPSLTSRRGQGTGQESSDQASETWRKAYNTLMTFMRIAPSLELATRLSVGKPTDGRVSTTMSGAHTGDSRF